MKLLNTAAKDWLASNQEFLGRYIVICLVALAQGALALSEVSINFLYKDDFHMTPASVAMTVGIINLPWTFKPFYGMLSDSVPLFGMRRKSYILVFSFLAFISWFCLAFVVKEVFLGVIVLLCIQLCTAFCNVIGEALLVEISQLRSRKLSFSEEQQQSEAAKNVSLFFGVKSCGVNITFFIALFIQNFYMHLTPKSILD